VPVALLVTVSPRLPGLLTPAGWRAVTAAPAVLALPGAAATAAVLRQEGVAVTDVAGHAPHHRVALLAAADLPPAAALMRDWLL